MLRDFLYMPSTTQRFCVAAPYHPLFPVCQAVSDTFYNIVPLFYPRYVQYSICNYQICLLMRGMTGGQWSHSMASILCIILAITRAKGADLSILLFDWHRLLALYTGTPALAR